MNEDEITKQPSDELQHDVALELRRDADVTHQDAVAAILEKLGVSESTATSARAIIDSLEAGKTPGENFVKLIVNALNHDEDIKNAEAAGYLRGRNEVIETATKVDESAPKPVNFPMYRKRSFWD